MSRETDWVKIPSLFFESLFFEELRGGCDENGSRQEGKSASRWNAVNLRKIKERDSAATDTVGASGEVVGDMGKEFVVVGCARYDFVSYRMGKGLEG